MRIRIFILILFFSFNLYSDTWGPIGPISYSSKGKFIAEIFPRNSRLKNKKPICYFYKINFINTKLEDYTPEKRFTLVWSADLVNENSPSRALVSTNGYLVTLDEHAMLGYKHSIVIYNKNGKLIKDFSLDDLIPEEDIYSNFIISTSSIWWRKDATYYFTNPNNNKESIRNPTHLYIVFKFGSAIEIELESGIHSYKKIKEFVHLDSLVGQKYPFEKTSILPISLKYSSITELLNCNN